MRAISSSIAIMFCFIFFASPAFSTSVAIHSPVELLLVNPSPQATAMGGCSVALTGAESSAVGNPASLSTIYNNRLSLNYAFWPDEVKYMFAGMDIPLQTGALGVSMSMLSYGRNAAGFDDAGNAYNLESSNETAAMLSYSIPVIIKSPLDLKIGLVGINAKFINKKLADYSEESPGMDAGAIYFVPFIRNLNIGVVARNFGAVPSLQSLGAGISYSSPEFEQLILSADGNFPSEGQSSLSCGLRMSPARTVKLYAGWQDINADSGAGLRVGMGIDIGDLSFNYAIAPLKEAGPMQSAGIQLALGALADPRIAADYHLKKHFSQARDLFNRKNYVKSRFKLDQILSLYPEYMPALELKDKIGQLAQDSGYRKEIELYHTRAELAFSRNDLLVASKYYTLILNMDDEDVLAKNGIEKVKNVMNEIQLEKVREENREMLERLWKIAVGFYNRGEYIKSKERFQEILVTDPKHEATLKYISDIDNQIASITATQVNEMYTMGTELFKNGRYDDAIRYFEAVVIAAPHRIDAEDFIARCKEKIQEGEEKTRSDRLAREQDRMRNEVETAYNRALKHFENGDYVLALEWFNKTEDIASRYEFKQYRDESRRYVDTIKAALAEKHYKLGFNFYQQNRFESAFSEYRKSLQYNPENPSVKVELDKLARSLAQQYYERGMSHYTQGQMDKAREYFRKSLSYKPDKEEPLRALERMK